jgi:hypothetical protein
VSNAKLLHFILLRGIDSPGAKPEDSDSLAKNPGEQTMILDVYFYGPLRVLVDQSTGRIVATQDRISGEAASFRFSPDYIAKANESAIRAHESQFSEA